MLRLPPTQIRLQEKDYKWHKPRHEYRQELRVNVPPADVTNRLRKSPNKYNVARTGRRVPHSVLAQAAAKPADTSIGRPDTSIYSKEPVPSGSRAFWDRVLAEAGTPTRIQTTSSGHARVIDPSNEFLDTTHSSRVSLEGVTGEGHCDIDDYYHDGEHNNVEFSKFSHTEDEHSSLQNTPVSSEESEGARSDEDPAPTSRHCAQSELPKRRLSWLPFHRKSRPANAYESSDNDDRHSGSMAVDGPSDRYASHGKELFRDSYTEVELVYDGLYGSRRDRRNISSTLEAVDEGAVAPGPSSVRGALQERPSLPSMSDRQSSGHFRHPSGSLPRSSLHISQAAASSSPDVLQASSAGRNSGYRFPESPGLLAFPPRRPRRYRPRSDTYTYEESGEFDGSAPTQLDGSYSTQATVTALSSLTVSYPPIRSSPSIPAHNSIRIVTPEASYEYLRSSPPEEPINAPEWVSPSQVRSNYNTPSPKNGVRISVHGSMSSIESYHRNANSVHSHPSSANRSIRSIYPTPSSRNLSPLESAQSHVSCTHPTPSPRNLSPYAAEFVPSSARRNATPFTLPPPFSATPRNVSFNRAIPSSSPHSPHTPPQRRTSQRVPSITELPSPGSPLRIPVYDDRRSPTNQPQTPAGLRRNGLPIMATQNPFGPRNPPATAPARPRAPASATGARSGSTPRVAEWQAFATPTRRPLDRFNRPFDVFDEDRENEDRMTEEERRWRREAMLQQPIRMGREEAGRMEGGLGLGLESPRGRGRELRELRGE